MFAYSNRLGMKVAAGVCLGLGMLWGAPKLGVLHWPAEDHPIWGPRLESALRSLVDADTGFGGAPNIELLAEKRRMVLGSAQFLDGGSKGLSPLFGVDKWVRLELMEPNPEHRVSRARWMPWKAQETWAFPVRLTVWDGNSGKVLYAGIVPGDETQQGNRFLPVKDFDAYGFFEQENLRHQLLQKTLGAAKDTLARVVLGRLPPSDSSKVAKAP
jgi:hypothetical protein